ncbi:hypothetical protein DPMN_018330 [Dreissena polymorpha]|uniref:Ubiquitin carboxyl-terminal hydrolase n=1 Tax=Dreissena polymorpha TaxID=45954 RepID=A0A9D4NGG6_DREPO|nr:hypothetical protein DPMN_018330 [Dreissena polymorpha]
MVEPMTNKREKWLCYICQTTESVWACLSCPVVACGRFNEKHALHHYQESQHPISIEVNDKYVYCYACDDYVLNDNAAGDIRLIRTALGAIATQKFTHISVRGQRLLRSYSHSGVVERETTDEVDKNATADWHYRRQLLAHVWLAWRSWVQQHKSARQVTPGVTPGRSEMRASMPSSLLLKRSIIPGVTGLRNLGNTCYMNSVLQVLSHIESFRDFFLKMNYSFDASLDGSPNVKQAVPESSTAALTGSERSMRSRGLERVSTIDCYQHLMSVKTPTPPRKKAAGGLNGGSAQSSSLPQYLICDVESPGSKGTNVSLCGELHGLLRVLWSGRWAQVSPHAFLQAVWQAIPMFKGYAQHDAQEFLCELLDKIQRDLDSSPGSSRETKVLTDLFQGQLVSKVTCQACQNVTRTCEPYMDLSLEFPDRYQITKQNSRVAEDICHITEMLAKFTEEELLEGSIYACEKCNQNRSSCEGRVYTEAKKQLLIDKLPPVLRLHLKRFRWSGRIHREKISTHVASDEVLDLGPFLSSRTGAGDLYQLFGVIIHHGKGFGSGHYTAYAWNHEAESWVNCNDSRMVLSSLEEVLTAQAYIFFYRCLAQSPCTPRKPPCLLSTSCSVSSMSSLKSVDTVIISESQDSQSSPSAMKSVSQSSTLSQNHPYLLGLLRRNTTSPMSGSLSSSPDMPSMFSAATLKYSLKTDGTELLLANSPNCDISMPSDTSVHFIDREVSFNFRNSPNASAQDSNISASVSSPVTRGRKRRSSLQGSSPIPDVKKCKTPHLPTDAFYGTPIEMSKNSSESKAGLRRSKRLNMNKYSMEKFEALLTKIQNHEAKIKGENKHVKRRKSSFW